MPLTSYLIAHPKARLTKEKKQALIEGIKNTFNSENKD